MRYRKKPVVIEAVQVPVEHLLGEDAYMIAMGEIAVFLGLGGPCSGGHWEIATGGRSIDIHTLEGTMTALPGDWIIRGVKGELYPCKPDIFEATYEVAD